MDTRAITLAPAGRNRSVLFADDVVRINIADSETGRIFLPQGVYYVCSNSTSGTQSTIVGLRAGVHPFTDPASPQPISHAASLSSLDSRITGEVIVTATAANNTMNYRQVTAPGQILIMRLGDVCQNNAAAFAYTHDPIPPS